MPVEKKNAPGYTPGALSVSNGIDRAYFRMAEMIGVA